MSGSSMTPEQPSAAAVPRWQAAAETAAVFVVFFLQGGWPVPDVNEPYYLSKAIHFWDPQWIPGDFFLQSADSHAVFYWTYGWVSRWLAPVAFAWIGRVLAWWLLAWSWRRLSFAVVPRRWLAVVSAALIAGLLERFHLAGEWVFGGVEAKCFAYAMVFFALEAIVRDRWNRAWLLFGAAAFFHILVGGWSAIAAGFAWLMEGQQRPSIRSMAPGIAGGAALALPGLLPALPLDWGVPADVVRRAHEFYVYERLYHHLDVTQMVPQFLFRFAGLTAVFAVLAWLTRHDTGGRRLRGFVIGAMAIALAGGAINLAAPLDRALAAGLLRFYWFRVSDVAVPLGVAILTILLIHRLARSRAVTASLLLGLAVLASGYHLAPYISQRWAPGPPRADRWVEPEPWQAACEWIAHSPAIPVEARFLTPRSASTFKWYAHRPEVVTWKEIPQDAASMILWWDRMKDIHGTGSDLPGEEWHASLAEQGADRLRELGRKYQADYVLTEAWPRLPLEEMYRNKWYAVYRLK